MSELKFGCSIFGAVRGDHNTCGVCGLARDKHEGLAATQEPAAPTLREALLDIARSLESLKRECGMDPESPTAIHNSCAVVGPKNRQAFDSLLSKFVDHISAVVNATPAESSVREAELIDELRAVARAYPEDVFLPLDDEDKKHPLTIQRASAAMGRHMAPLLLRAADALAARPADPVEPTDGQKLDASVHPAVPPSSSPGPSSLHPTGASWHE